MVCCKISFENKHGMHLQVGRHAPPRMGAAITLNISANILRRNQNVCSNPAQQEQVPMQLRNHAGKVCGPAFLSLSLSLSLSHTLYLNSPTLLSLPKSASIDLHISSFLCVETPIILLLWLLIWIKKCLFYICDCFPMPWAPRKQI